MDDKVIVSIIVPVYNVEEWMEECIKSILIQSYRKFELILIDDGSTDKSGLICDEYASAYSSMIRVFHQDNKGVSAARNKGIDNAVGEYIVFVDPDDVLHEKYLETMINTMYEQSADMAVIKYTCNINELNKDIDIDNEKEKKVPAQEVLNLILDGKTYDGYLWNRMFRSDIIKNNNIRFINGITIWEDLYFVIEYLQNINICVFVNRVLYYYRVRDNGAVNTYSAAKLMSKVKVCKMMMELSSPTESQFNHYAEKLYVINLLEYGYMLTKEKQMTKSDADLIKQDLWKYKRAFPVGFKSIIKMIIVILFSIRVK